MENEIEFLKSKVALYENNGGAKLYYSLQRKMNEMADLMNATSLRGMDITDNKDKSFERIKAIWGDAEKIALAVKALGDMAGITGNEEADVAKKPFVETIAESRR